MRTYFVRTLLCTVVAALAALFVPTFAAAQVDVDLRTGVYSDESDAFVGLGLLGHLGAGRWYWNPNAEWVFVDHGDLVTLNADFHVDLADPGAPVNFWLGGGPALIFRDPDRGDSETDFGFNLLAGVGFLPHAAVRPYVQGKLLLSDDTQGVVAFGLRF